MTCARLTLIIICYYYDYMQFVIKRQVYFARWAAGQRSGVTANHTFTCFPQHRLDRSIASVPRLVELPDCLFVYFH